MKTPHFFPIWFYLQFSTNIHRHSWHEFIENGPRRNIAQLWKLFSYITIRILNLSSRNCVSSLLSTHYRTFLFTDFDFTKAQSLWSRPKIDRNPLILPCRKKLKYCCVVWSLRSKNLNYLQYSSLLCLTIDILFYIYL